MVGVPQIPYAAIGLGLALFVGVWAFVVAEAEEDKAVILIAAAIAFGLRFVFPSRTGRLVSLVACMIYGIGCLVYLRLNGVGIR
jgi:hypothetical protein